MQQLLTNQYEFDFMKENNQCTCNGTGCECNTTLDAVPLQTLTEHNNYTAKLRKLNDTN